MAINIGSLDSLIRGGIEAKGFDVGGKHARIGVLALAVATGVVNEILSTAKVIVPAHAGGTYPVTGLSAGGMNTKIKASLQSQGFVFGEHSMSNVINEAISSAVTSEVLAKCTVTIPYDGSGTFQVIGLSGSALALAVEGELEAHGFNLANSDSGLMASVVGDSVAATVNGDAVVSGGFAGGGVFPVL